MGDTILEGFLPKNQHTQGKLLNFKNWCSGDVPKSLKKMTFEVNFPLLKKII